MNAVEMMGHSMELVDALALGASVVIRRGSSPLSRTLLNVLSVRPRRSAFLFPNSF